jgi:hypothetical protein
LIPYEIKALIEAAQNNISAVEAKPTKPSLANRQRRPIHRVESADWCTGASIAHFSQQVNSPPMLQAAAPVWPFHGRKTT